MPLVISTRTLGKRKPLLDDFSVPPPPSLDDGGKGDATLRDIIEHVVRQEVKAFVRRQNDRRFDRVLSASQIEAGATQGKVDPAGKSASPAPDPDVAIAAALQAFEDGLYLVIIDDVERRNLDETIRLRPDSHLVFIRLVFLAGA